MTSLYGEVERITRRAVRAADAPPLELDQRIDRIVTSRALGLPLMTLILAVVFWLTIVGSNVPSQMLATAFFWFEDVAAGWFEAAGAPWWLTGFVWHGVIAARLGRGVMLLPMAFLPAVHVLEDLGYLPWVAFNLDFLFSDGPGKQA